MWKNNEIKGREKNKVFCFEEEKNQRLFCDVLCYFLVERLTNITSIKWMMANIDCRKKCFLLKHSSIHYTFVAWHIYL